MNFYNTNNQNTPLNVIAIDGPAASGKTSVGKRIADHLGYLFLDTGIMYRAVTWLVLRQDIDPSSEIQVSKLAENIKISITSSTVLDNRDFDVIVEGQDVTWKIREKDVNEYVSQISSYAGVRTAMTKLQRAYGEKGNIVMVGRDIGTVVMPEADLKIFLNASADVRAARRYQEELKRGKTADLNQILSSVKMRDEIDSNRTIAPLQIASDAVVINTDNKSIDEVVNIIIGFTQKNSHESRKNENQ